MRKALSILRGILAFLFIYAALLIAALVGGFTYLYALNSLRHHVGSLTLPHPMPLFVAAPIVAVGSIILVRWGVHALTRHYRTKSSDESTLPK